jgi:hypothetical protein
VIQRASIVASLVIHGALIALLALKVFEVSSDVPRETGMEIEIVDLEHAMPLTDPVLPSPSDEQARAPSQPQPASAPARVDQPQPAPARLAPRVPQTREPAPVPPVLALGPGRVTPVTITSARSAEQPRPVSTPALPTATATATATAASPAPSPRLNSSALARSLGTGEPRTQRARINSATLGSAIGQAAPRGVTGLTVRQRAELAEMVRSQVIPCWNPPAAEDGPAASVKLRFRLDREGNVVGRPSVSGSTGGESSYMNLLANSGRRAIVLCAPLELPAELYDAWAEVEVEFDPRDLR